MAQADDPGVLDTQGLADRYKVSKRTVEDWRYKETGPDWFWAGTPCYHVDDVVAWERKRKEERKALRKAG